MRHGNRDVSAIPLGPPNLTVSILDAALETLPVGVVILDSDRRVVRANAALCARRALGAGVASEDIELDRNDSSGPGHRFAVSFRPLAGAAGGPAIACYVRDLTELVTWRQGLGGIERLASELSGAVTQAEVTDLSLTRGRELVGAESVAAALLSEGGSDLDMVGMAGFDERIERNWTRSDLGPRTPMSDAVISGRPVFLESAEERARDYPDLPHISGRTIAAVPIKGRGSVIGAIAFRFAKGRRLECGDRSVMMTLIDEVRPLPGRASFSPAFAGSAVASSWRRAPSRRSSTGILTCLAPATRLTPGRPAPTSSARSPSPTWSRSRWRNCHRSGTSS